MNGFTMKDAAKRILRDNELWTAAVFEHYICWKYIEEFIFNGIQNCQFDDDFWILFMYYYRLNRGLKSDTLRQLRESLEKIARHTDLIGDFGQTVELEVNKIFLSLKVKPYSATSKVLFHKFHNNGMIYDTRVFNSINTINSQKKSFSNCYKSYVETFEPFRSEINKELNECSIPGVTFQRVLDKFLWIGCTDKSENKEIFRILGVMNLKSNSEMKEAAEALGVAISQIFGGTT